PYDFPFRGKEGFVAPLILCLCLFCNHAVSSTRFLRCLFFSLFIRQRPLSIPAEHGAAGAPGSGSLDRDRSIRENSKACLAQCSPIPAYSVDFSPNCKVSGRGHSLSRYSCGESTLLDGR